MSVGGVQEELDALAVRLGHGLTIDSVEGEVIAYSTQRDDVDEARISSILLRHVAPEVRQWEAQHVHADTIEPVTIPANPALGMSARVCVPLRRHGRTLGFLWMMYSGDGLDDEDQDALRRGADALAGRLDMSRNEFGTRGIDLLVRRLFDDGQADAYNQIALAVPGIMDGTVRVVAAVTSGRQFSASEFSAMTGSLTAILRASPGYVGSSVSPAYALVVLHHRAGNDDPRRTLDELDLAVARCLQPGTRFTLGISDSAELSVRSARKARHQALEAAELAGLDPALERHSYWSALGAYRLLLGTSRRMDPVLRPLSDAGRAAPMLLETLETFLDMAGDIQAIAARLNLHRSSLYYRLDRIERLLGADLSNGLTRLELHLALKDRRLHHRTLGSG